MGLPAAVNRPLRVVAPTLVLLVGAAARIAPLADNRFHPDEALFASYGRLISTGDWNLATRLVDKPPLSFYLMAGAFMRIGPNEIAARLPGLAASLLSLALVWHLAMRLWRDRTVALLAMVFFALSPMAVLFAPTAFTDPLLVLWLLAALASAAGGRWGWTGIFVGLAASTKQTALFFLPLVVAVGLSGRAGWPPDWRGLARFLLPVGVTAGLLAAWEGTRGPVLGFWQVGVANNAPGGLVPPGELWPRLLAWGNWLRALGGWPPANVALVLGLVALAGGDLRRWRTRAARLDLGLAAFTLAYFAAYWLVGFNVYDRYLLPLVPLVGLLLARALAVVWPRRTALAVLALAGLMAWPALRAARSGYPVGGDHGAHDGIDEIAAYLDGLPAGTVFYDHWLGWPLDFYLFDSPAYTTYFATPEDLAAELRELSGRRPAVLLLPAWVEHDGVLDAVSGAGYEAGLVFHTTNRFGERNLLVLRLTRPEPGDSG